MDEKEAIRQRVSDFYAQSVNKGCGCGSSGCCGQAVPDGALARFAGYDEGVLKTLPPDAVVNSFGCGNPLALSEVQKGQTVIDLGSGAGMDLLIAAQKVGPGGKVIGVDMTEDMIVRARQNLAAAKAANVEVRQGIIEQLPVDSESVDWVISNCVINLSPEKEKVFSEIFRVLKPGGCLSISDIVAQDLPAWMRENMALYGCLLYTSPSPRDS